MENRFTPPEIIRQTQLLSDVEPIAASRDRAVLNREQLKSLVEPPLLSACEELFDKNIRTLETTANRTNIETGGNAAIVIDHDSLSETNRLIAAQLVEEGLATLDVDNYDGYTHALTVLIPLSPQITVQEIEDKANAIAHRFIKQAMTWASRYNFEQAAAIAKAENQAEIIEAMKYFGFYYDEENQEFFASEEHYRKFHESVN